MLYRSNAITYISFVRGLMIWLTGAIELKKKPPLGWLFHGIQTACL